MLGDTLSIHFRWHFIIKLDFWIIIPFQLITIKMCKIFQQCTGRNGEGGWEWMDPTYCDDTGGYKQWPVNQKCLRTSDNQLSHVGDKIPQLQLSGSNRPGCTVQRPVFKTLLTYVLQRWNPSCTYVLREIGTNTKEKKNYMLVCLMNRYALDWLSFNY